MLENLALQFNALLQGVGQHVTFALSIIALLWLIQLINAATHYKLNVFGIIPREGLGLIGLITSPFLHGNFSHLFLNSIPLFVLSCLVLINGVAFFLKLTVFIMLVGGIMVWLFGRKASHIGASGVVMGYWAFLLINAVHHFTVMTVILAVVCLYYFSSMVMNLFPTDRKASFEGHLFGALAGVLAVYLL